MQDTSQEPCLLKQVQEQDFAARAFGFYWENIQQLIAQIQSECLEVQEAWAKGNTPHLQEEIGDLIHAAISLAVFFKMDPPETLLKSIEKFQRRYNAVVQLAKSDGYESLQKQSYEILTAYWNRAKLFSDQKKL